LARALIDLDALRHNYRFLKSLAPNSHVLAVIKADAYGHGVLQCAKALNEEGVDGFAVARIEEALHLRSSGIKNKILILEGVFSKTALELAIEYNIDLVFHDTKQLELLDSLKENFDKTNYLNTLPDKKIPQKKISCWIKINTGMNRLGFGLNELGKISKKLAQFPFLRIEVLMTHFANADSGQLQDLEKALRQFEQAKPYFPQVKKFSLANSAAIIEYPETHADWIRPGISLYGASTLNKTIPELKPVMQLSAPVLVIHKIAKGEAVGYGSIWTAPRDTYIAVIGIGYGDGYPRHAKNNTPVHISGHEYPIVGRVSMDMITVDLGNNNHSVQVDDLAILWGTNEQKELSADVVAKHADTISYELFCGVTQRVIKEYIGG